MSQDDTTYLFFFYICKEENPRLNNLKERKEIKL